MSIIKGMVVVSGAGHDKGEYYYVKTCENGFAQLINGKTKKHINPKYKNIKHLIKCDCPVLSEVNDVSDKKIRRLLREIAQQCV